MEELKNQSDKDEPNWWTETEICREFCRPHAVPRAKLARPSKQGKETTVEPKGEAKSIPGDREGKIGARPRRLRGIIRTLIRRLRRCGILA